MRHPDIVNQVIPVELHDTVNLIEAWARWATSKGYIGKVKLSGIYNEYQPQSVYAKEAAVAHHSKKEIMACNRAWMNLNNQHKRLIQFYYVLKLNESAVCLKASIRKQDFDHHHVQAVRSMRQYMIHTLPESQRIGI